MALVTARAHRESNTSGAILKIVPTHSVSARPLKGCARPKSQILGSPLSPTITFSSFRSQCRTSSLCRYCRPSATWGNVQRGSAVVNRCTVPALTHEMRRWAVMGLRSSAIREWGPGACFSDLPQPSTSAPTAGTTQSIAGRLKLLKKITSHKNQAILLHCPFFPLVCSEPIPVGGGGGGSAALQACFPHPPSISSTPPCPVGTPGDWCATMCPRHWGLGSRTEPKSHMWGRGPLQLRGALSSTDLSPGHRCCGHSQVLPQASACGDALPRASPLHAAASTASHPLPQATAPAQILGREARRAWQTLYSNRRRSS